MNNRSKVETLANSMMSFTKESYSREEVLPEALALQKEIIHHVFGDTEKSLRSFVQEMAGYCGRIQIP